MKIKNLLIIAGIASFVGVGYFSLGEGVEEAAAYVPRSVQANQAEGIDGYFENLAALKANIYTGQVEAEDAFKMQKALEKKGYVSPKNDALSWESMGPNNVGGRTRAILALSSGPNDLMAGSTSGGLFRSNNAGVSWEAIPSFDPYLVVSSIAQLGNGAIYVATGNSREGISPGGISSGFIGRGLFVSTDEGNTWDLVQDFEPTPWNANSDWATIDVVKADPSNPNRLWIGANHGFFSYMHDTGELSVPEGIISGSNVKDIDISASGEKIILCISSRLYLSEDFGETFTHVNDSDNFSGFPSGGFGTCELAISRQDDNKMYASLALSNGFLRGIFASIDGGNTWNVIAPQSNVGGQLSQFTPFFNGATAQGWYDNMITSVATPQFEGVIMGGIRMWRWNLIGETPGITVWEEVNDNFASSPGSPPSPIYVHSDIHTDEWDSQERLYIGCDGGIFRSDNFGVTWTHLPQDYITTQFYHIAFNPFGQVMGGTQDNNTLFLSLEGTNPKFANAILGGDGMSCEMSQYFPDYLFASQQRGNIFRSTDGGLNMTPIQGLQAPGAASTGFYTQFALHENPDNANSEIFVQYSPQIDSPFLVPFEDVTPEGDSIIARIPAGTEITVEAENNDYILSYTTEEDVNFYSYYVREIDGNPTVFEDIADTAFVQERPQFLLAAAFTQGIWVSRQPLKTNGNAEYIQVDNTTGTPESVEWSPDGDHLYIGYRNGELVRISGFNSAWTAEELDINSDDYALDRRVIHNAPASITDIEVDYSEGRGENASERVAISIAGYGGNGKIRVSDVAASVSGLGTFENVWNVPDEFTGMPAYSVVMDINDPNILIAGTEYGIWYSGDNGATWSESNNGDMVRVPVFDLRQQKRAPWNVDNSGVVYAGTHGKGIMRSDFLFEPLSTEEIVEEVKLVSGLKVFPNPVTNQANISFDLGQTSDIEMYVYSIDGRLIEAFQEQRVGAGQNRQIEFNASDYPMGQYIVQLRVGDNWNSAKFVVTR
jgi:hypothetical protein